MSLASRAVVDVSHAPRRARDARTRATGRRHRVIQKASPSDAVQRAKGGDYNAAAATFVNSFFYDGNVDTRDVEYKGLTRACSSDMKKRYAGDGNALVVILDEDDSRECLACGGVEVRKYVGAVDYESYVKSGRGGMDVEGKIIERPIVANLATARAARRKGYGKAIMGALEDICAENGFDECCLVVEARNKRAQGLYRKLGYKVIGSDAKAAALEVVDGRSRETTTKTLVMRKSLTNPGANVDTVTIGAAVLALALLSAGQQALVDALYVNFGIDLF
jgi:GNAT superfamily N-acetyltransferase